VYDLLCLLILAACTAILRAIKPGFIYFWLKVRPLGMPLSYCLGDVAHSVPVSIMSFSSIGCSQDAPLTADKGNLMLHKHSMRRGLPQYIPLAIHTLGKWQGSDHSMPLASCQGLCMMHSKWGQGLDCCSSPSACPAPQDITSEFLKMSVLSSAFEIADKVPQLPCTLRSCYKLV
jgi:hypothetical protein